MPDFSPRPSFFHSAILMAILGFAPACNVQAEAQPEAEVPPENQSPAVPIAEAEAKVDADAQVEAPADPILTSAPPLAYAPANPDIKTGFNTATVPTGTQDLRDIQAALQSSLKSSLAALVCIEIDGGSGSGVIVSESGLILSAAHVVMEPGKRINIILSDGKKVKGETLGIDPQTDGGMARILDEGKYPFVPLGNYSDLKLGHWCYALGHSGGWDEKRGAVVRLGRIIRLKDGTMQSDCKLIGGDSGGPIFDMYGRLIGINSRVGNNVEESLHCPTSVLVQADEAMRKGIVLGQEDNPYIGIGTEDTDGKGVKVVKLAKDGPAERDGLQVGDILLSLNNIPLTDKASLTNAVSTLKAGQRALIQRRKADGTEDTIWIRSSRREGFEVMGA